MNNQMYFNAIGTLLCAVAIVSCGKSENFDLAEKLKYSKEFDGKQIEVSGKIDPPFMIMTSEDSKTIDMKLRLDTWYDNTKVEYISDVVLGFGKGKNSVEIEVDENDEFTDQDVTIYDNAGNAFTTEDVVTIRGTVQYAEEKKEEEENEHIKSIKDKVKDFKVGSDDDKKEYSYKVVDVTIVKD